MTKVKICGLTRMEDIETANEVLPDYIGFVFAKSKRQVTDELAAKLKEKLDPRILAVGVFVNEAPERIICLCKNNIIDVVQLHGDESEGYILQLKQSIINPIVKAIRVRSREDLINTCDLPCDYYLLDAYREDQYGGSGVTFDWSVISKLNRPFILAGGIDSSNVEKAIHTVQPYAIDVSSGVETEGIKDRNKIIEFIIKVRSVG